MVLSESQAALTALAELAPHFNAATDAFMSELREIEAMLEKLKIGLPCELAEPTIHGFRDEVQVDASGEMVTYRYISRLAYERLAPGWGLAVRGYRGTRYASGEYGWTLILTTPLLNAARETRIAAAPLIPTLLDVLVQTTTESLHALTAVADTSAREQSPDKISTFRKMAEDLLKNTAKTAVDERKAKLAPRLRDLVNKT